MKYWISLFALSFTLFTTWHGVDGTCALPTELQGTWIDTLKGPLEINNSVITGYNLHAFGSLTLNCWMQNDTVYVFESSEFEFYSLNFTAYFCWNFTKVSDDMFYFYEFSPVLPGAGYERVRAYLPTLTRVYDSICANPDPGLGTFRVIFRNGTLESNISPCPGQIQAYHTANVVDDTGTDTCNGTTFSVDVCTNQSAMVYNSSGCGTHFAYSDSGYVYCLFTVEDAANNLLYMSLYNDGEVDDSSTHSVTCMTIQYGTGTLKGTQYPRQCPETIDVTNVTAPGAQFSLSNAGSCTSSAGGAFPIWILAVVGGIVAIAASIIIICCYKKKKDEEEKTRRNLLGQDEEDDDRFDPDKYSRGERPPFVSITIMADDDRRRSKDGRLVDGKEDKPIEIKRPKADSGKRRLDKRKRVWVIDKDGKVKKVWKDDKESPDSGVEDDEVDGEGGSTGRKTLSSQDEKDKEADDLAWAKKHGRKGLKDTKEIVEKGDKKQGSAKLQKKMKGMASARRSARFRQSASRSAMSRSSRTGKSTSYFADDDGERSWGSSDGEYEEVILEKEEENLKEAQEAAQNKLNEEMEKKRQLEGKDVEKGMEKLQGESAVVPVVMATVVSEIEGKEKNKEKDSKTADTKDSKDQKSKTKDDQKAKAKDDQKAKTKDDQKANAQNDQKAKTKDSSRGVKEKTAAQDITDKGLPGAAATAAASTSAAKVESTTTKESEAAKDVDKGKGKGKGKGKQSSVKKGQMESTKLGPSTDEAAPETPKAADAKEKVPDAKDADSGSTFPGKEVGGAAAGGAGVIVIAAAAKKLEAQRKKEQKQKEKEEKKREKEEKKRKEKEEKEMKKKAEATKEEPVVKYVDVKAAEEMKPPVIIQPVGKENEIDKKSDQDSGHASPRSTSEGEKKVDGAKKKETDLNLSREKTLSASLKPRREQSIVLDMDRSKSTLDSHEKQSAAPTSAKEKTLEAVSELVDTARERADAFAVGKDVATPLNSADQKTRLLAQGGAVVTDKSVKKSDKKSKPATKSSVKGQNENQATAANIPAPSNSAEQSTALLAPVGGGKNEEETRGSVERGKPTETKGKEKSIKKATDTKTSATKGAITPQQTGIPVKKITVNEANEGSKKDLYNMQDVDTDFESSEEEFVPVKKSKPVGFTFPDENKLVSTFRTTGDIIHTMPVKKKVPRRMPRKRDDDLLPERTAQAFGLAAKTKPPPGKSDGPAGKDAASKASKEAPNKSVAAAKGPITIKDLSKKPVEKEEKEEDLKKVRGPLDHLDAGDHSDRDTKASPSPHRRKSEFDRKEHLQLMTQLMSLSEVPESELNSRAQSRKSGQSKASAVPGINLGNISSRGRNGTPELLQTSRQDSVVAGRPPNQHSYIPSRETSAALRGTSGHSLTRSHSDRRTNSVTFPDSSRTGVSKSSSSTNSEERFARFKEGVLKQLGELGEKDLNAILYPRVQRYPEDEEEGTIKRGRATYKSMGTLQRIHRRNRQVAPEPIELPAIRGAYGGLIDDYDDVEDPRMKGLLEELYNDKKYLDKSLVKHPEEIQYVRQRTMDGSTYLLNRARFWSTQRPLVRPGTQAGSRASTTIPSSRLVSAIRDNRTRSEERPSKE